MRPINKRPILIFIVALVAALIVPVFRVWKANANRGGQQAADPFRIAGNFYYVGANDVCAFLIDGPEGHVLFGGGYPASPALIIASMEKLGFDIKDVKALLNWSATGDIAGAMSGLQQASGAELWTSEASARGVASGGVDLDVALPLRILLQTRILAYPPARVDHLVKDGDIIRVGPIAVTAHATPGSSRGCMSWTFPVQVGERTLNVVSACGMDVTVGLRYPEQSADIERSLRVLRSLPADIWVTSRGRAWGRYRKFAASSTTRDPVEPFIDPEGYRAFIDAAEADFRQGVVH